MKAQRYKLYLVMSLLIAFGSLAAVILTDTKPKLGLDLEGGLSVTLLAKGPGADNPEVLDRTTEKLRERIDNLGVAEPEVTRGDREILVQIPGIDDEERALKLIGTTAQLTFREVLEEIPAKPADDKTKPPEITEEKDASVNDKEVIYPLEGDADTLLKLAPAALTGDVVTKADANIDATAGAVWYVNIRMNDDGAKSWEKLTGEQACQRDQQQDDRIAIVIDGEIVSSPGMDQEVECKTGIQGGESRIETGGEQEAKDLALVLTSGALPVTLERQEVQKISPTLGSDSLQAGLKAGLLGLGLVMIYMVLYYRALGFVVWLGLAVFTSIIYTFMALLGETAGLSLSLAGVAGVIVSVGVTADSYIVAFERLKDEVRSGKSMRAAVERGMSRAFKTILVADFVTGSAAVILFFLAVGSVKGFALTLGLATLTDVLVAYFFTRSAVGLLARTRVFREGRFFGMKQALGAES